MHCLIFACLGLNDSEMNRYTVLPAKSDSDVMFCLNSNQGLTSIYHLCINPSRRIGLIHTNDISIRISSSGVFKVSNLIIVNKT